MKISKWFKRFKLHISWITAVVAAGAAIASVCLTLNTLEEMRIDRNNAYRPDVVIKQEVSGVETSALIEEKEDKHIYVIKDDEHNYYYFDLINIGVGVAKNIDIKFNENSVLTLAKWIKENTYYCDVMKIEKYRNICLLYWSDDRSKYYGKTTDGHETNILYLLPDAKQSCKLYIPDAYVDLVQKVYYVGSGGNELTIRIKWEDIQGKKYQKIYALKAVSYRGSESVNEAPRKLSSVGETYKTGNTVAREKLYIKAEER